MSDGLPLIEVTYGYARDVSLALAVRMRPVTFTVTSYTDPRFKTDCGLKNIFVR
jgi:hypothetical protein